MSRHIFLAFVVLGCSCSSDETTSSTCDYIGGTATCVGVGTTSGCRSTNQAVDSNLSTFGDLSTDTGGSSLTATGKQFPGGTNAGVFITPPDGMVDTDITLNTFLMGAAVDSATGPALIIEHTGPQTGATNYVSLNTTAPFDSIQLVLNVRNVDYLVYEFCGGAVVR